MTDVPKREFETEVCSRCCGTGSYSYCQMHGSTCFKCEGKGKVLTAKGRAAILHLRALRSRKAGDVKVGERVSIPGYGKFNVVEIKDAGESTGTNNGVPFTVRSISLNGKTMSYTCPPSYDVGIVAPTREQRNAEINKALDYQDTLTKAGTVRRKGKPQ